MMRQLLTALSLTLLACTTQGHSETPRIAVPGDVVILVRGNNQTGYGGYCNAFATVGPIGTLLTTASHCVTGTRALYVPPSGWGLGEASLLWDDAALDVAVLSPTKAAGLHPFARAAAPFFGAPVSSYSALYNATSVGTVKWSLGLDWLETTQTICRGWSGSPVVDASGAAWGVISRCHADADRACLPDNAIVATLP